MRYMNESCPIYEIYEWVMSHIYEAISWAEIFMCIRMRHVTCHTRMRHTNESCHTCMDMSPELRFAHALCVGESLDWCQVMRHARWTRRLTYPSVRHDSFISCVLIIIHMCDMSIDMCYMTVDMCDVTNSCKFMCVTSSAASFVVEWLIYKVCFECFLCVTWWLIWVKWQLMCVTWHIHTYKWLYLFI